MSVNTRFHNILYLLAGVVTVFVFSLILNNEQVLNNSDTVFLSKPIASETVLITSAGLSTDTYIVQNAANKLRLHSLFMPQATYADLEGIASMIVVVGHSDVGYRLAGKSIDDEKERLDRLIESATVKEIPIILVYLGGKDRLTTHTRELIGVTCGCSDYIIATKKSDQEYFIDIAQAGDIPLTLINDAGEIVETLAAAFR